MRDFIVPLRIKIMFLRQFVAGLSFSNLIGIYSEALDINIQTDRYELFCVHECYGLPSGNTYKLDKGK